MKLGEIWDYCMRRKLLLLVILCASILIGVLSGKLCFGGNRVATDLDIPRTGEVTESFNCKTIADDLGMFQLGNGVNRQDGEDGEKFDLAIKNMASPNKEATQPTDAGSRAESVIITAGATASLIVLILAKFIFDRYVR